MRVHFRTRIAEDFLQMDGIHVTKLEAARRQLCAAIRMFFAGADELAIHTVASAARGVVSDLRKQRGHDEAGEDTVGIVFWAVWAYHSGELPPSFTNNPAVMKLIKDWVGKLSFVDKDTTWDEFREKVGNVSMPPKTVEDYWRTRTRVANFLKHADRDPIGHLAINDIDNVMLLQKTVLSFIELLPGSLMAELFALGVYSGIWIEDRGNLNPSEIKAVDYAARLNEAERRSFCGELLPVADDIQGSA